MNVKITSKDGITLKTQGKYCTEDIHINVGDEVGGGGSNGLPIEVEQLPETAEEGAVYKTSAKDGSYTAYAFVDHTLLTLEELFTLVVQMPLLSYNIVDSLPTENILITDAEGFNVYYHKNNGLYVYGDLEENGTLVWVSLPLIFGVEFKGEVSSVDEIPAFDGIYVLNDAIPEGYHLYKNSTFNEILTFKDDKNINQDYEYGKVYKGSIIFGTDGSAKYLMKFHEDCVEIIINETDAQYYWKIYTRTYFYFSNKLVKHKVNHNFYLKTANSIFIPLPYFISIGNDGYMSGGNYISLEFNLNGSKFKVSGLTSDKTTNFKGSFLLQSDTTEWDNLITTIGVPEINEDTEV